MSRLSPRKVENKFMRYYIDNLINAFNLCLDREELEPFIKDLFTKMEIRMLAKRLQIALMLYEGCDYRTIINRLKVTNQTVGRVAQILDYGEGGLEKVVEKISKIDQKAKKKMQKGPQFTGPHKLGSLAAKYALEKSARELLKLKRKREVKKNLEKKN
ncbi:hypothetical protein B5M47_01635 [candidate division CPR3 bacterium 4484_211]|uniref:TrpR like protein, YerC/YecD n=1 Tax=candidate division CPR3 bacterium 4484_211 TaxID=1968527 RepID=A0A1W9NYP6_UNCC3|nr:MAG: hypothetical protein B5M47_01635 [candidate division CPR3 bacterium 4484_211]